MSEKSDDAFTTKVESISVSTVVPVIVEIFGPVLERYCRKDFDNYPQVTSDEIQQFQFGLK